MALITLQAAKELNKNILKFVSSVYQQGITETDKNTIELRLANDSTAEAMVQIKSRSCRDHY